MPDLTAGQKAMRAEARRLRKRLRALDAAIGLAESDLPPDQRARQIAAQLRERDAVRQSLRLLAALRDA